MTNRPVAIAVALILGSTAAARTAGAAEIHWFSDVNKGWQATQSEGRPMLLFVTKKGCKYCVKMKRNTYADADLASQVNEAFVPVMIDSGVADRVLKNLKIRAYPTTLVISPDAVLLDNIKGYVPAPKLSRRLSAAEQNQEETTRR